MRRWELTPEKIEMVDGQLFDREEQRLLMLGMLLENAGCLGALLHVSVIGGCRPGYNGRGTRIYRTTPLLSSFPKSYDVGPPAIDRNGEGPTSCSPGETGSACVRKSVNVSFRRG